MPYGTPSKAYTNSVPDKQSLYPAGQHTLAFYIKCVPPVGHVPTCYKPCVPARTQDDLSLSTLLGQPDKFGVSNMGMLVTFTILRSRVFMLLLRVRCLPA